ncbi:MAG TPA: cation:proton antiporter [Thermoanaerobaculia bacterium]|nr:cation:proton antiporter [Thermoanaerobaculia bacterium]
MHADLFLKALTIVLGVAALTTLLFHRLRQPVVLGYILAGIIIGPHVPVPLVADPAIVQTLSELGVVLLMFSIGLEFSLSRLARASASAGLTAAIETSIAFWLGFVAARLFGWTMMESLFAGGMVAISSTTIITKAFAEQKVEPRLRERVIGILLVEDLIAILLMATLTMIARGGGLTLPALGATAARLFAFLIALVALGYLVVPRAARAVLRQNSSETTLIAAIGFCFATALLAAQFGYPVALGAFIAGSLISEAGAEKAVEHLIAPVRDMFVAVFFVSVGLMLDPMLVVEHWRAVLAMTVVVLVAKSIGASFGAFLAGSDVHTSVRAGISLAQIGEFSFIIAGLGVTLGAARPFLFPVAVATSIVTALCSPFLIRGSRRIASAVERKLPAPLHTAATLYGAWIERMWQSASRRDQSVRRLMLLLVLDALLLFGLIVGTAVSSADLGTLLQLRVGASVIVSRVIVLASAAALAVPLWIGLARVVRRLAEMLALRAFPAPAEGEPDLNAAPRATLVVALKFVLLLLVGLPIVALTQPFLPGYPAAAALTLFFAVMATMFWRRATALQGHVRAGSEAVFSALSHRARRASDDANSQVERLLAAFGSPAAVTVAPSSEACGRTLAEIDLHARTGAMLLAIRRGDEQLLMPRGNERLEAGDIAAVAGTAEAVRAAEQILGDGAAEG